MGYSEWINSFNSCQIVNLTPQSILDNNFQITEAEYKSLRLLSVN